MARRTPLDPAVTAWRRLCRVSLVEAIPVAVIVSVVIATMIILGAR